MYWELLRKYVENLKLVKIGQKHWALYIKTLVVSSDMYLSNTDNALMCFHDNSFSTSTIQRDHIVAFSWKQLLRERATELHYAYIAYLVSSMAFYAVSLVKHSTVRAVLHACMMSGQSATVCCGARPIRCSIRSLLNLF